MTETFFFDRALLPDGWRRNVRLECSGGQVTAATPDSRPEPGDRREAVAVPGLPNLHSHAFQRAMAGLTERRGPGRDNFWSWRDVMYRFAGRMGPDEAQAIAAYAYADMAEAGFTAVGEFHYVHRAPDGALYANPAEMGLRHFAAAESVGLDVTLLPVSYAASGFGGQPPSPGQKRFITDIDVFSDMIARLAAAVDKAPGRKLGVAAHSLRAVPPELLGQIQTLRPNDPMHIHIAEQVKEVEDCVAWSGRRPVEWLLDHAPVDGRWCLVHATHMTAEETSRMARSGAVAGLCPITEANLGDGVFPAEAFLADGGRFGVGSDSNVEMTAAGELRMLEYSQRLTQRARNVLSDPDQPSTGQRLFEAALLGGAQALGCTAGLQPGARANFVVLDADHPDLAAAADADLLDTWIFSAGRAAVHKTAVGGRIVVEHGRHHARQAIDHAYRAAVARLSAEAVA